MLPRMARSRDGVEIAYDSHGRTDGDAPTVILVHGWAGNRTFWSRQVDVLAEGYHVVTVDLGGHGESGTGRGDWNLPAFGDDVVAVVEAVGARDVALVGHSMGGDAIVFAARLLGDRVRGLVWVDTLRSLGDEPTSSAEDVAGFVAPFHADFGASVDRFARSLFSEVQTRRWSIWSPEAWSQRRRKPRLDPSATPSTATHRLSPPSPRSRRP
jgi:pimeloyl-ACP methyl ester carboxylesterase